MVFIHPKLSNNQTLHAKAIGAANAYLVSEIAGFSTGGTIHLIINNQVGFTTAPADARSSPHCTDIAKTIG